MYRTFQYLCIDLARLSQHCKMNTSDFKKAKVKHTENHHSTTKNTVFFLPQSPPLQHYPEEQFIELWFAKLKGSFGDKSRLALNLNS